MAKSVDDRGRGVRMAPRAEGAYRWYVTEAQRSQLGCIGREGPRLRHSMAPSAVRSWYLAIGLAALVVVAPHGARAQLNTGATGARPTAMALKAPSAEPAATDSSAEPSPTMADPATAASVDKSLATTQLPSPRPHDLIVNWPVDLGITFVAGTVWLSSALLEPKIAPTACRWCASNGFDSSLRSALRWKNPHLANTLSNVFSFGFAPLMGTGVAALAAWHDNRLPELPSDALVAIEAAFLAEDVTQLAKVTVARQRPYAHARSATEREQLASYDDNASFFSGHAALAFSLATSAGTIASMRGYRLAPLMWVAGLAFATTGAYMRVAADKHYTSDVLTGALVGAAIGFSVPYFAHRTDHVRVIPLAAGSSRGLAVTGVW